MNKCRKYTHVWASENPGSNEFCECGSFRREAYPDCLIPKYGSCVERCFNGTATRLEEFIYHNQPRDSAEAHLWREDLIHALRESENESLKTIK